MIGGSQEPSTATSRNSGSGQGFGSYCPEEEHVLGPELRSSSTGMVIRQCSRCFYTEEKIDPNFNFKSLEAQRYAAWRRATGK
jgi:hypothetical protein